MSELSPLLRIILVAVAIPVVLVPALVLFLSVAAKILNLQFDLIDKVVKLLPKGYNPAWPEFDDEQTASAVARLSGYVLMADAVLHFFMRVFGGDEFTDARIWGMMLLVVSGFCIFKKYRILSLSLAPVYVAQALFGFPFRGGSSGGFFLVLEALAFVNGLRAVSAWHGLAPKTAVAKGAGEESAARREEAPKEIEAAAQEKKAAAPEEETERSPAPEPAFDPRRRPDNRRKDYRKRGTS